jgi:DNA-binding CsgD family transcriptional regulator
MAIVYASGTANMLLERDGGMGFWHPGPGPWPGRDGQDADRSPGEMHPDERETVLAAAERLLRDSGRGEHAVPSINTALLALISEDLLDQAAFWCETLRNEWEGRDGGALWDATLTGLCATIELRQGNLTAADTLARAALAQLPVNTWGVAVGGPLSTLLEAAIARHQYEDAARYLRVLVPEAMHETPFGLLYQHARGGYYLATGSASAALADFRACGDRMIAWGLDRPGLVPWRTKAAEAHLVLGNGRAAGELTREQLARAGPQPSRVRGVSLRVHALTLQPGERVTVLRESAELLRHVDARLELAYTFGELANAYRALGEHDRADLASRMAGDLEDQCGVRALDNSVIIAPAVHGEPDKKPLSQLSNAERRVAKLAAHGCTNQQIAEQLHITVSTVEQHLTRVYRKLGLASRADLPTGI